VRKSRFTNTHIVSILKELDVGTRHTGQSSIPGLPTNRVDSERSSPR